MSREVWLRTNWRAFGLLGLFATAILLASLTVMVVASSRWVAWGSAALAGGTLIGLAWLVLQASRPRLAYARGELLVYLRGTRPIAVPIDVVECFLLGRGASGLPRPFEGPRGEAVESATIVLRVAEAARDWSHRPVWPALGQWCEGYVVIRGTWCEPIHPALVMELNHKLIAAHRSVRHTGETTVTG